MKFVHRATYSVHIPIYFSPQDEVLNLSMQLIHTSQNHGFIFPYLSLSLAHIEEETDA